MTDWHEQAVEARVIPSDWAVEQAWNAAGFALDYSAAERPAIHRFASVIWQQAQAAGSPVAHGLSL